MAERRWRKASPMGALSYLSGFDWGNLPEDMKVEILFRLPDKPLTRLKCVSKYWYFLISTACDPIVSSPSPYASFCGFIYTCRQLVSNKYHLDMFPCLDYCNEYNTFRAFGFDRPRLLLPFQKHRPEDVQDCCNGIFLLARFGSLPTEYYVCNPTTCQCIAIPINPCHVNYDQNNNNNNNNNNDESYIASLAFDPSDSPCSFKIIRRPALVSPSSGPLKLDVFSYNQGKNGNWATHSLPLDHALQGFNWIERSVYLNGFLYLLSLAKFLFCIHLSIKRETNMTCRAIKLPGKDEFDDCGSLGVVRGHLLYCNSDKSQILVWLLEDGVRWILQHRISTNELAKHPMAYLMLQPTSIKVYGFDPKTGEIFVGTPSLVQSYDPETKKLRRRVELPCTDMIVGGQYSMFPYSRCTVILNRVIPSSTRGF